MFKMFKRKKQSTKDIQKDIDNITRLLMDDTKRTIDEYYKRRK